MAGAITAWAAEAWDNRAARHAGRTLAPSGARPEPDVRTIGRSNARTFPRLFDRLADLLTPLTVACVVLAVAPDFDVFFRTHRTYSHSLGAAAIVWLVVAVIAWRLRLPVVRTASVCAAAYASHVLLDWLGRDTRGLMALWPLSRRDYRSGLDLFFEFTVLKQRHFDLLPVVATNLRTLAREVLVFGLPFAWMLKVRLGRGARRPSASGRGAWSWSPHVAPEPKVPEGLRSKA